MHCWHDVKRDRIKEDEFLALIEIQKGSKNKYELDKETGHLILDRVLFTSTHYPQNYGFIPLTYASDYDPLDVLVLCSEPILPMSLVKCHPIGALIMVDNGLPDEKIIAVPVNDPFYSQYQSLNDIPAHIMDEIKHFFTVYKTLEGKTTAVDQIVDVNEAKAIIRRCIENYKLEVLPTMVESRKR